MKKFVFAAVLATGLAACGSSGDDEGATGGKYSAEYDVGDGSTATVTAGGDIEVDLPMGFEVYPGSKVITTMVVNNAAVQGRTVMMETGDDVQKVADFYRAQAKASGIEINMETASAGTMLLAGRTEGEAGFNMMVTKSDEGKTTIQLTVSEAGDTAGG